MTYIELDVENLPPKTLGIGKYEACLVYTFIFYFMYVIGPKEWKEWKLLFLYFVFLVAYVVCYIYNAQKIENKIN